MIKIKIMIFYKKRFFCIQSLVYYFFFYNQKTTHKKLTPWTPCLYFLRTLIWKLWFSKLCKHLKTLIFFSSDSTWDKVQHECIKCLKAIMNNKVMFVKFKFKIIQKKFRIIFIVIKSFTGWIKSNVRTQGSFNTISKVNNLDFF